MKLSVKILVFFCIYILLFQFYKRCFFIFADIFLGYLKGRFDCLDKSWQNHFSEFCSKICFYLNKFPCYHFMYWVSTPLSILSTFLAGQHKACLKLVASSVLAGTNMIWRSLFKTKVLKSVICTPFSNPVILAIFSLYFIICSEFSEPVLFQSTFIGLIDDHFLKVCVFETPVFSSLFGLDVAF